MKHLLESQTGLYSKTEQPKQQKMSTPVQDENVLRVSSLIEKSKKLLLNLDLERVPLSKLQELNNSLVKEWNEIAKDKDQNHSLIVSPKPLSPNLQPLSLGPLQSPVENAFANVGNMRGL